MRFRNNFYFLSNMFPCKIKYKGLEFNSAESFFQACKNPAFADRFCGIDGFEAKKLGRKVPLRPDWNEKRLGIMLFVLREKFKQNPELLKRLKEVNVPIVEENDWNDRFWGVCRGEGQNNLGKILEQIKREAE